MPYAAHSQTGRATSRSLSDRSDSHPNLHRQLDAGWLRSGSGWSDHRFWSIMAQWPMTRLQSQRENTATHAVNGWNQAANGAPPAVWTGRSQFLTQPGPAASGSKLCGQTGSWSVVAHPAKRATTASNPGVVLIPQRCDPPVMPGPHPGHRELLQRGGDRRSRCR